MRIVISLGDTNSGSKGGGLQLGFAFPRVLAVAAANVAYSISGRITKTRMLQTPVNVEPVGAQSLRPQLMRLM